MKILLNFWEEDDLSFEEEGVEAPAEIDGKLVVEDSKIKREVYWEDEDVKWIFTFKEKPKTNKYKLKLEGWEDFNFFYQPELEQWEIDDGCFRPDRVIGSYAVCHKTKRDNIEGGKNYKTGKAMHIYRPQATDSEGKKEWVSINIKDGVYEATIPQAYLDSAVYPIRINDTFGYTSAGGTEHSLRSASFLIVAGAYSPASNGSVTSISAYLRYFSAVHGVTFGLYDDNSGVPDSRMADSSEVTLNATDAWETGTLDSAQAVTSGTTYWPAVHGLGDGGSYGYIAHYDSGTKTLPYTDNYAYVANQTPSSFGTPDGTLTSRDYSIYATYTPTTGEKLQINIGDAWKQADVTAMQINIGDAWKAVAGMQINIGDAWKTIE